MHQRHYSEAEAARVEGSPLPIRDLCEIWRGLPESKRFAFVLSLEETIADRLIEATAPAQSQPAGRNRTQ